MDVGTRIDNYEIIEHIGRGGMADVWSARDTTLGRMVAIKTIARNLASEADPVTMFQQEARTIAGLDHPNILPIFGFGEIRGMFYIAMRFVAGGSMEDELRRGAMTYREIVATGKAVASALDFAHKQRIIHLDLKPPNILLDSQGLPYLADFGLATRVNPDGHAQNPGSGTLLYMAPEQLTSDTLDHRADIYSFGLVLFHMLTGKLPFEAMAPLALKQLQFQEDLPHVGDLNPDLPDEITDILRRGTSVNPNDRHDSTIDLMQEVEAALGTSVALPEGEIAGSVVISGQSSAFVDMVSMFDPEQVQINEARDIFERARLAWDNGNGRFLLSVTHFMVMSDYYVEAKKHNLSYDEAGAQMLLRGALEYDYHIRQWWHVLGNESRRWVCMHTIRSESPSARIRAFKRLETLPDDDPPVIPRQVAQALSIENNTQSMLTGL
ncbi:MAG: serine/threonine-protein kinase, partial [Chloroflexota bacterium]